MINVSESSYLCAGHGEYLGGASPLWGHSRQPLVEDKGVHREVESEGSPMQSSGLRNTNHIRRVEMVKCAKQYKDQKTILLISKCKCGRQME